MTFILFFILAYLIGSINSAILLSKMLGLPDPRKEGSGNPGTTNMLRLSGKKVSIMVLVFDILKGFIPVFLACLFGVHGFWLGLVGLAAIAGHTFPVFFKFQGGKGVATTIGVIFPLSVLLGIALLIIFVIIVAITRYVSLGSMVSICAMPIICLFTPFSAYFLPLMIIAVLVVIRHKENIYRLRNGVENKLKF